MRLIARGTCQAAAALLAPVKARKLRMELGLMLQDSDPFLIVFARRACRRCSWVATRHRLLSRKTRLEFDRGEVGIRLSLS